MLEETETHSEETAESGSAAEELHKTDEQLATAEDELVEIATKPEETAAGEPGEEHVKEALEEHVEATQEHRTALDDVQREQLECLHRLEAKFDEIASKFHVPEEVKEETPAETEEHVAEPLEPADNPPAHHEAARRHGLHLGRRR